MDSLNASDTGASISTIGGSWQMLLLILYQKESPSGRLSVSFPHSVCDLLISYDYLDSVVKLVNLFPLVLLSLVYGRQYVRGMPQSFNPSFGCSSSYNTFTCHNAKNG